MREVAFVRLCVFESLWRVSIFVQKKRSRKNAKT